MDTEEVVHLPTCHERLSLHFENVCYSLPDRKRGELRQILHNVSGEFVSGRLTAILGASGAGKTSLLNVLSGFKTKGVTGTIKVNGVERNSEEFRTKSCYITQDQSMLPQLTSRETLTVAANLKLQPGWEKDNSTRSVVSNIFQLLGLSSSENTSVRCLSGGEKKRLSIGLELITNPPIMFFDEPTSGLDSSSSLQVISHLQTLSNLGHAIVCVIHQPSSRIFNMFDDLYLVSDGQCLYSGSTASMVHVFQEAGFACPEYYNRADFAIEVACRERGDDLSDLMRRFQSDEKRSPQMQPGNQTNEFSPMLTIPISIDTSIQDDFQPKAQKSVYRRYPTSHIQQFNVLLRRSIKCTIRDLHMAQIRFSCHIAVGILLGIVYFNIGNEASKVDSNVACLFFFLMFLFFSNSMPTTLTFPIEMSVFLREHLNNWYSLPAYYFAKLLSNLPLQILCPVSFMLIGYYMTDQPNELNRVLMTLLAGLLITILAQATGLVLGALLDVELGVFLVPVTAIPMILFSGFFLRLQDIPGFLNWLGTVSYFKHGFEALVVAIYGFNRPNLVCSQPYCHHKNPSKLLEDLGMSDAHYWSDIGGLVGWIVGLHVMLYAVLKWRIYRSK